MRILLFTCVWLLAAQQSFGQTPAMGGGFEDDEVVTEEVLTDLDSDALLSKSESFSSEERIWDINDSLMHIPAYDTYCHWSTDKIHIYNYDLTKIKDTVQLVLRRAACDYSHPFRGAITSNFGERGARHHYGIDIKLYKGDPVKVAFEGVVRVAHYSSSYGNVVVVRHNNGLETLYAHLSARKCKAGDHVEAGDIIGLGGNTGRSTGSHLHFECRYKGEPLNPNDVINWEDGTLVTDVLNISAKNFAYLKEARAIKYYRIRSGDTLSGIARKNGTSVSTLCRLNRISKNATIYPGKNLRVR